MRKTTQLWQTLAVSIALALAVPAFAQSQSRTPGPSNPPATSPSGGEAMKAPQSGEAGIGDKAATQADRALNQRIRQALSSDSTLAASASKIHLESDNGEVTLHGSVATDEQKSDIVNKISQMGGVKKIHDQLKVGV
jgi:osmotically-inducible protein OsmY